MGNSFGHLKIIWWPIRAVSLGFSKNSHFRMTVNM